MAEPLETAATDLAAGTKLGKYEILRKLAMGGMAEIYLARIRGHAGFEKLVVIKRILPSAADDPRLIGMFLDEARLVAALQHPNIADVHEVGEEQGAPYFAMEHIHGEDVRTIRHTAGEKGHGVPLRVSLAIIHAVASALDYAHARKGHDGAPLNLVHRDISPSNVLVSYEGAIKLIDFGVARATGRSTTTQAGTVKGKVPYMSPEQCRGLPFDSRTDMFSLGVLMYELTVGKRPFSGAGDFDVMQQIVLANPARPSVLVEGYPARLEKIVMKLLARKPDARYSTGEQLLNDLEPFMQQHQLWVAPKKISKYMHSLFHDRVAAWEAASRGDVDTFIEHVALAAPERNVGNTPPTPVPVVMRLAQEIQAVARNSDASLAVMVRPGEDPLAALAAAELGGDSILGGDSMLGGDSIAKPGGDTVTIRTGESSIYHAPANEPGGDTITIKTGQKDAFIGDAISGDTITVKPGNSMASLTGRPTPTTLEPTPSKTPAPKTPPAGVPVAQPKRPTSGAYHVQKPKRVASEVDDVAAALEAPSMLEAIDKLGTFDGDTNADPPRPAEAAATPSKKDAATPSKKDAATVPKPDAATVPVPYARIPVQDEWNPTGTWPGPGLPPRPSQPHVAAQRTSTPAIGIPQNIPVASSTGVRSSVTIPRTEVTGTTTPLRNQGSKSLLIAIIVIAAAIAAAVAVALAL